MILWLCLLLLVQPLQGQEKTIFTSFQELSSQHLDGKEIAIKGFLYKSLEDKWILASEPNLKSCCVGSKEKHDKQIYLEGFLSNDPPLHAVMAEGRFKVRNNVYTLSEVKLIEENKPFHWMIFAGMVVLFFALMAMIRARKQKKWF